MNVKIYGIEIPNELLTPTIKNTKWNDIEPLPSISDINIKWIGNRPEQVSYTLLKLVFSEDEKKQASRLDTQLKNIAGAIDEATAYGGPGPYKRIFQNHLLGDLRYAYILKSLLSVGDYERYNRIRTAA